jgi:hypothetical protein
MALTVGLNCYLSLAQADAYFNDRIDSDNWDTSTPADKGAALVTATRIIDNEFRFIGQALSSSQSLAWPRAQVAYFDPRLNTVVTINSSEYPQRVRDATCEQAYHLLLNENLLDVSQQTFERIKVGPIEIEDSSSDYKAAPRINPSVNTILKPLLLRVSTSNSWSWR